MNDRALQLAFPTPFYPALSGHIEGRLELFTSPHGRYTVTSPRYIFTDLGRGRDPSTLLEHVFLFNSKQIFDVYRRSIAFLVSFR